MQKTIAAILLLSMMIHQSFAGDKIDKNGSVVLLGKVSKKQLSNEQKFNWFLSGIKAYTPKKPVIDSLKSYTDFSIVIVLGTWCSDTKEQLPKMIKVLEAINMSEKNLQLIAVGREKKVKKKYARFQAESVPTFFVIRSNDIIGKIIEAPAKSMEEDLLAMLQIK